MFKNNYHTHMRFCNHAYGDVEDYVKAAINFGFDELGMSDHDPVPVDRLTDEMYKSFDCPKNMSLEQFELYIKQIDDCKKKYPNIKILKGLECEYLYGMDDFYQYLRSKLDYLILGIHYFMYDGKGANTYAGLNKDTVKGYIENADRAFATGLYKYFAHPDLFFYKYKDENGVHVFDELCVETTYKLIDIAVKYDVYFEINCNGLNHCRGNKEDFNDWIYPNINFWRIVKDYQDKNPGKLKLIIGADSHHPQDLYNDHVVKTLRFIDYLGLKVEDKCKF